MGSVAVEFLQDCGVGVFEQPLLGGGGGVADVHEDPVVAFAAIHAAAADGVVQALVLQNTAAVREAEWGYAPTAVAGAMAVRR